MLRAKKRTEGHGMKFILVRVSPSNTWWR